MMVEEMTMGVLVPLFVTLWDILSFENKDQVVFWVR
jgi:hypothetical protein